MRKSVYVIRENYGTGCLIFPYRMQEKRHKQYELYNELPLTSRVEKEVTVRQPKRKGYALEPETAVMHCCAGADLGWVSQYQRMKRTISTGRLGIEASMKKGT